jgi:TetR/AcrR family transcriptional regulator, regulator of cefoperazone and chloramphenicol sensitivity
MPRDGTETRDRLVREAERLFARDGIHQVTLREVTEAAEQRNASAVQYHFGSRGGLLREILVRHGRPIDEGRGAILGDLGDDPSTRDLVRALLVPYSSALGTTSGRDYLRIVAQLSSGFAEWDVADDLRPPHLRRILALLEDRAGDGPPAVRRERVLQVVLLLAVALAERARVVESGKRPSLGEELFLDNLADMIVGALEAPVRTLAR